MKEKELLDQILIAVSRLGARLFRNNTGVGWAGKLVAKKSDGNGFTVTLANARPIHAGLIRGSSDLIGWTTVKITPEMVGQEIAVFTAIEAKAGKTRPTKHQSNFLAQVSRAGGVSAIAKTVNEAIESLKQTGGNGK